MHNWNTDTSKFKSKEQKTAWELVQLIDYGLQGKKLSKKKLIKYWDKIKNQVSPSNKRLYEFLLWEKVYSLPNKNAFWSRQSKTKRL